MSLVLLFFFSRPQVAGKRRRPYEPSLSFLPERERISALSFVEKKRGELAADPPPLSISEKKSGPFFFLFFWDFLFPHSSSKQTTVPLSRRSRRGWFSPFPPRWLADRHDARLVLLCGRSSRRRRRRPLSYPSESPYEMVFFFFLPRDQGDVTVGSGHSGLTSSF